MSPAACGPVCRENEMAYEILRFPYPGTIDADGHVLEPADLWEDYLETTEVFVDE